MKKNKIIIILIFIGIIVFSCAKDAVTYCPFCSHAGVKEISTYDVATGFTEIHYECQNSNCGKIFGAGKVQ